VYNGIVMRSHFWNTAAAKCEVRFYKLVILKLINTIRMLFIQRLNQNIENSKSVVSGAVENDDNNNNGDNNKNSSIHIDNNNINNNFDNNIPRIMMIIINL
jgi:hypothetical protein